MRNKIFVLFSALIFLLFFVGAPLFLHLTNSGVLPYENVGNEITVEKEYREDHPLYAVLTAIERGKAAIKDTYINYLPGFLSITNTFKPMKSSVDRPFLDWLAAKGRELTPSVCRHVYTEQVVAATCTAEGYTSYTCRLCGEGGVKDITSARGHRLDTVGETVISGCEYYGYTAVSCLDCTHLELSQLVRPVGHDYYLASYTPATCTAEGGEVYACRTCAATLTLPLPVCHTYERVVGSRSGNLFACTGCGKDFISPEEDADYHSHREECEVVPAGCNSIGYVRYTCTVCGDSRVCDSVLPSGHRYLSDVISATCTTAGYIHRTCDSCRDERDTDHVAPLGHQYTVQTVKPTVLADGYDLYSCGRCHYQMKANFIPALILGIDPPTTVNDPEGTRYNASLISNKSGAMFRVYELTATYPDGTSDTSYVRVIAHDRDAMYANMLETAEYMAAMEEVAPEVNWYFSFATNIEAIPLCNEFFPEESVEYIHEEFLARLPGNAWYAEIAVNSFKDYANKFYVTDHHWNAEGVQEAYYRILSMLRENYDDITPPQLREKYMFDGVQFYGSLARQNASYVYYDDFGLYFYDLPEHTLTIDDTVVYGSKNGLEENLSIYLDGRYETKRGYNHYTEFYRVPSRIEYPENNTGRRLLVIGDSYSLPLIELVAASFDVTFVRYEDRGWDALPEDLYFDEFVAENGITDVLVIEEPVKLVMKGYGTHYPSGFINIYPSRAYKEED